MEERAAATHLLCCSNISRGLLLSLSGGANSRDHAVEMAINGSCSLSSTLMYRAVRSQCNSGEMSVKRECLKSNEEQ